MSVRRLGSAVFPVGLLLWLVALLANVVMRVAGITDYPWHVVLFPLWGAADLLARVESREDGDGPAGPAGVRGAVVTLRLRFWLLVMDATDCVLRASRQLKLWAVGKASDATDWGAP